MLIWFKSDAFVEYAEVFGLSKILKLENYQYEKFNNPYITYPLFLKTKCGKNRFQRFLLKLIGCKLCTNIWASMVTGYILTFSLSSFIKYSCVISVISLFIFGIISKLLDEN
jgi:hypothetical protein